jgi:hypothetical protein
MRMTSLKWAQVIISLLVSIYLFTGIVPMMHFHKDGIDHDDCSICNYYLNYHSQDLPSQSSVIEIILFHTFSLSEPVVNYTKIVFHNDPPRAPPQLQFA